MDENSKAQAHFVRLTNAYEILKDPLKRLVYDRLGMASLRSCEKCLTFREYFYSAFGGTVAFYAISFFMVLGLISPNDY